MLVVDAVGCAAYRVYRRGCWFATLKVANPTPHILHHPALPPGRMGFVHGELRPFALVPSALSSPPLTRKITDSFLPASPVCDT